MHLDDGGVQAQGLHAPVAQALLLQVAEHLTQQAVVCPALQAHVHRVPGAKAGRQAAPLAAIAGHVDQGIEKAVMADAHAAAWPWQQMADALELGSGDVHAIRILGVDASTQLFT